MILKFNTEVNKSPEWDETGGITLQNITTSATHHGVVIYKRCLMYRRGNEMWLCRSTRYSLDLQNWTDEIIEIHRVLKKMGL